MNRRKRYLWNPDHPVPKRTKRRWAGRDQSQLGGYYYNCRNSDQFQPQFGDDGLRELVEVEDLEEEHNLNDGLATVVARQELNDSPLDSEQEINAPSSDEDTDSQSEREGDADSELEREGDADSESEREADADSESGREGDADSESEREGDADSESEMEGDAESEMEGDSDSGDEDQENFDADGNPLDPQPAGDDDQPHEDEDALLRMNVEELVTGDSDINVAQAVTLLLGYMMRHTLTKVALIDLLLIIQTLMRGCRIPGTKYYFEKFFEQDKGVIDFHYYCDLCFRNLGSQPRDHCECGKRKKLKKRRADGDFFLTLPVEGQIKQLLERPEIADSLNYRFYRNKQSPDNLEDIYDGALYQSIGELSDISNISVVWNTDGVQVSKSSNFSIWPIQLIINELPPKLRRRNIIMAGLWFGEDKPNRDLFYEKFVEESNTLLNDGVKWRKPDGSVITSKVFTLACTADSPARCMLKNAKQFNGKFGCSWCLHKGKRLPKGRGTVRVYKFQDEPAPLRTAVRTLRNAEAALVSESAVNGVRGMSCLMLLESMDIVKGFSVDYLHVVLSGVTKATLNLWLDPPNKASSFYIGRPRQMRLLNERLLDVKPPNFFPRTPRRLQSRSKWKAKEHMCWLLYYSLPCTVGILPPVYFNHWILLVEALFIFLKTSISLLDFERGSSLLWNFVKRYGRLYGQECMSSNVHALIHIPECVRNFGPLWTSSTFIFESNNNSLVKLAHGTQEIPLQIAEGFSRRQALPSLFRRNIAHDPELANVFVRITSSYLPSVMNLNQIQMENDIRVFGKPIERPLQLEERVALEMILPDPVPNIVNIFKRATYKGEMYHTEMYTRVTKRISYFVKLRNSDFVSVRSFCVVRGIVYAFCFKADISRTKIGRDISTGACPRHIHLIENLSDEMRAVEITSFLGKCLFITSQKHAGTGKYCIEIPNIFELD